ncbi:MAG: hypothetical protein IJ458_03325 [Clostridia bacterium]|nr:hypothetical protein [Clostridia bacterium]
MKGYYTKQFLQQDKFYQSLIYSYMDKVLVEIDEDCLYTQFHHEFNTEGEFIYRAIHNRNSSFDKYSEIEMCVNDEGVFVQGQKHDYFSANYLYALNIFKNKYNEKCNVLQK